MTEIQKTRNPFADAGGRVPSIDLLRGIAVLLVIVHHLTYSWPDSPSGPIWSAIEALNRGGWIGVDLFFVLSGFLVSGLIFREFVARGQVDIFRFLIRRGFKIYPAFWVLIITTVVIEFAIQSKHPRFALVSELTFMQNYGPALWNHTWTLAVEEHFYLGLAFFVAFLMRFTPSRQNPFDSVPHVACSILVLTLVNRCWNSFYYPWGFKANVFLTHLRLDSLMFGVLISWLFWFRRDELTRFASKWRWSLLCGGIVIACPAFVWPLKESRIMTSVGFTAFYVGMGMILLFCLYQPIKLGFVGRLLAGTGFYSYSIYLWHMPVLKWVSPLLARWLPEWNFSIYAISGTALCLILGLVAAWLIEIPVLRIRERLFANPGSLHSVASIGAAHSEPKTSNAKFPIITRA